MRITPTQTVNQGRRMGGGNTTQRHLQHPLDPPNIKTNNNPLPHQGDTMLATHPYYNTAEKITIILKENPTCVALFYMPSEEAMAINGTEPGDNGYGGGVIDHTRWYKENPEQAIDALWEELDFVIESGYADTNTEQIEIYLPAI